MVRVFDYPFDFVSRLTDAQARALNIPGIFPYSIKLKSHSNIGSPNYRIEWQAFGNGRQLNVDRIGCFLKLGKELYRVGRPIWSIIECIDQFDFSTSNSFEEKTTFVAELKSLLPQADNSAIQFDGELAAISLHHAAAFSLQITGSKSSLSFNPVLFNKLLKLRPLTAMC